MCVRSASLATVEATPPAGVTKRASRIERDSVYDSQPLSRFDSGRRASASRPYACPATG